VPAHGDVDGAVEVGVRLAVVGRGVVVASLELVVGLGDVEPERMPERRGQSSIFSARITTSPNALIGSGSGWMPTGCESSA